MTSGARRALALACAVVGLLATSAAVADEVAVPIRLQLELLERVVRYERGFASASTPVHVLVVGRNGSAESARTTAQLLAGLRQSRRLGGRPMDVTQVSYTNAAALRSEVRRVDADVLYLGARLDGEIPLIAAALSGTTLITVSAVAADVDRGMVLGFELVSSRPRIVVNLTAARASGLRFNAQFLRLARIVQ